MTRLASIEMSNFRGIEQGRVDGLTDVNLVVGRNNSGKSTVAEAIMRVAARFNQQQDIIGRSLPTFWSSIRNEPNAYVLENLYRSDASRVAQIVLQFHDESESADETLMLRMNNGVLGASGSADKDGHRNDFLARVTAFRPPDATNVDVERRLWRQLLNRRIDKRLAEQLSTIYDMNIEQIQVPPDGRMTLLFADHAVSLDVQGDGARAAMRCLVMLGALEDTLLIIEEPEDHQNPTALERFAKAVCSLAASQRVQLFISTHSLECVRAFLGAVPSPDQIATFHFELSNGQFKATRLVPRATEGLMESGIDPRKLADYL